MAISPKHLEKSFQEELKKIENEFDKQLSGYQISKGQSIHITAPSSLTWPKFEILKERYINAGWVDVIWNSDQRDGDFLTFKY